LLALTGTDQVFEQEKALPSNTANFRTIRINCAMIEALTHAVCQLVRGREISW
jgi:hypothetical protein